jgi:hypothetical protein
VQCSFLLLSALSGDICKELTLDEAVSSPLFIVFTVIGGFFFVLMSALEEQTKQERAQRISNSIK